MPEWLGAVLFIGVIIAAVYGWEALKDRGGKTATAMEGVEAVGRGVGWLMIKLYALVILAVAGLCFWVASSTGEGSLYAAGGVIAAYGLYLLLGGSWVIY